MHVSYLHRTFSVLCSRCKSQISNKIIHLLLKVSGYKICRITIGSSVIEVIKTFANSPFVSL
mgnify:CR=1 FL=1